MSAARPRRCAYCGELANVRATGEAGCVQVGSARIRLTARTVYACLQHQDDARTEVSVHASHTLQLITDQARPNPQQTLF